MSLKNKVQLITYADSLGGNLANLSQVLSRYFPNHFNGGIHILPPFPSTGDHGFSPITYFEIDPAFGSWENLKQLSLKYDLVLDLMVNHISSSSAYFQDYLQKGSASDYAGMFINIQKFWPDGNPPAEDLQKIVLRRTLPFSNFMVGTAGEQVKLWTTFGKGDPSDQVDVDVDSAVTRDLFSTILDTFVENGISIIRLDAVGYVIKKPGTSCFFVTPEIYEFLHWVNDLAGQKGLDLLPEVHSELEIQQQLSDQGFWIYDFMLPYLILEALITKNSLNLKDYLRVRPSRQFTQLDCHDGIPVKPDLNGYYDPVRTRQIVETCELRGANFTRVISSEHQDPDGFDVHQICGTYYSMLNEVDDAYYAARVIQLFTPGIPQIYYVGLLAGKNDFAALERTHDGREINRHSYSLAEIEQEIQRPIVQRLARLIEFRNTYPAFDGQCQFPPCADDEIIITWKNATAETTATIHLETNQVRLSYIDLLSGAQTELK